MSSEQSKSEDKPAEFSTLMLLLRAACTLNAGSNAEVSISTQATESFGAQEIHDPLLAPLEALAAILVQHGEVIAASYTLEAGAVIVADSGTLAPKDSVVANTDTLTLKQESNIPDGVVPARLKVNADDSGHPSCNYIITTNSYWETQGAKASNPHNLRVMDGGKDLWREFKDEYHWIYAL